MATELLRPGGHADIFAEHVGGGAVQLKVLPGGVEDSTIPVLVPEQIVFEKGGLTAGMGLMVIANEEVCPGLLQFILDPYTCMLPAVALKPKSTVI
jgi:hypothetical protein